MAIREARAQTDAIRLPLESGRDRSAPRSRSIPLLVVAGLTLAFAFAMLRRPPSASAGGAWLVGATLVGLVVAVALVLLQRRVSSRPSTSASAWLSIDDSEIARVDALADGRGRTSLARWGEPFGLSVLANMARSRALLVFTTPAATRFLGLRLETARDADATRDLMAQAITVPDADLELAAGAAHDVCLSAANARVLLGELTARDEQAMQRIYLSDAHGSPIVLSPDTLQLGGQTFDLALPIDWRVFTFNEGEPGVLTLYQATSIRQGGKDGKEVVLVCRAPAELASWGLGRTVDAPPAREARVAIDRLFMTPLRAALERAPRVSRSGPASRSRGKTVET
jgi:hypothetical protein